MKDIRRAFRALLLADPTVNGLVGGDRIFPNRLEPQDERRPSLIYHRITGGTDYVMNGDDGLQTVLMQLNAWSFSQGSTVQLADAAHDAISGFHGRVEFGAGEFIDIQGIFNTNLRDQFDEATQLHGMGRDYRIVFAAE